MYGVFIEGLKQYVEKVFGTDVWWAIVMQVSGQRKVIQTLQVYGDSFYSQLLDTLSESIGVPKDEILFEVGSYFIQYLIDIGFNSLLHVLGTEFVDFLHNVDDLHHQLQFSYPRIRAPAFVVLQKTETEIRLLYESKRTMFEHFVRGQLISIAQAFYDLDVEVDIESIEKQGNSQKVFLVIRNKNGEWPDDIKRKREETLREQEELDADAASLKPSTFLRGESFFSLFPYYLVISQSMEIIRIHCYNTFELVLVTDPGLLNQADRAVSLSQATCKFKGQMSYVAEWDMLLFLGSPVIRDTKQLSECGLYISDLNMFDSSREIVMRGEEQSDELMKLFKKQLEESKQLEKSMKRVDKMRKMTDELLYQCIPKAVARKLRNGTPTMETIHAFDSVSICFTKVVSFAARCMKIEVNQIISLLNSMYTLYDALTETHKVYKVETIGDSYMIVSGAPQRTPLHAAHITEMALVILDATRTGLGWPSPDGMARRNSMDPLQLFVGCHTGPIVAGVVGYKTPRYCLFGDTVNTSSRMMSNGVPDRIHVSNTFASALSLYPYEVELRGEMQIKGKGAMKTYFVTGRKENFQYNDPNTKETIDFKEVLKADFLRNDETPTESTGSELSISMDDFTEDEDSIAESMTPKGNDISTPKSTPSKKALPAVVEKPLEETVEAQNDEKPTGGTSLIKTADEVPRSESEPPPRNKMTLDQQIVKTSAGEDSKPENETANRPDPSAASVRRGSRKSSTSGKDKTKSTPSNLIRPRKLGLNDTQDTTKVLNEAAKRLNQNKVATPSKQEGARRQDVTFAAEKPSEIPSDCFEDEFKEEDGIGPAEESGSTEEVKNKKKSSLASIKDTQTDGAANARGQQFNRNQLITVGDVAKSSSNEQTSPEDSSINQQMKKRRVSDTRITRTTAANSQQTNGKTPVEKFTTMVEGKRFPAMPVIPFRSAQAEMFRQLVGCSILKAMDSLANFCTENFRKLRDDGC
ncbi:Soluble guanylate cyclase 88E [Fasciola gigantica]|uniref:guanylate cyclase n=1 Tax=Fasciola gigantica TaxID=46835 RepID=A0A504YE80_FASGI|nr:Soluble guanylate cyclase 88E [Fasciola gigantica]